MKPNSRLMLVALGILMLAILALAFVNLTPVAHAGGKPPAKPPRIFWTPRVVTATVAAGGTVKATATFSSTADLNNVRLWLTPSFAHTVTISPTTFVSVTAGVPYNVDVTFTAPATGKRKSFLGELMVRSGWRVYPMPLGLRFKVTP